jgi:hypothetical protein
MKTLLMIAIMATLTFGGSAFAALEEMVLLYDTYVDEENPGLSYGSLNGLRVRSKGFDFDTPGSLLYAGQQHMLLQFDLSSIPQGATLTDGVFGIFLNSMSNVDTPSIQLWDLNNNAWNDALTWNDSLSLQDNKVKIGAPEQVEPAPYEMVWGWNILHNWDYADALAAGKVSFLLTVNSQVDLSLFAEYFSGENAAFQPYLRLAYVPEPATMGLLAMGLGGLVAFRKKS